MERRGELSNKVVPKILLVFENALGIIGDTKEWDKWSGKGRWDRAIDYVIINDIMARQILWLYWKRDIRVEIVTYISQGFADELADLLDAEQLPVKVWYTTPTLLARKIPFMPDLSAVYDPEPSRWLTYGSKGRFIRDARELGDY